MFNGEKSLKVIGKFDNGETTIINADDEMCEHCGIVHDDSITINSSGLYCDPCFDLLVCKCCKSNHKSIANLCIQCHLNHIKSVMKK